MITAMARSTMSRRGTQLALRSAAAAVLASTITACVTVDHNTAASLGTAGMQATQALSTQASGAVQTLGDLSQWWGVHDTLVCVNASATDPDADERKKARETCIHKAASPQEDPSVNQLIAVLNKSKQATDTLNQAYSAFVDLAHYNAGQQATAALNRLLKKSVHEAQYG